MQKIITTLFLDFLEAPLNTGIPRLLKIKSIAKKASICMGVRRCGKSTYLFQIMASLLKTGVQRENIFYLNFFDDRLHDLQHQGLQTIIEAYYSLYPEKKNTKKVYFFFDEIQVIRGWEPFIDRLLRTEHCEIYISGSSAQMLSKDIATQMRGRALSWELFPFSFREYLNVKHLDIKEPLSTKKRLLIKKEFEKYEETGGFPEVIDFEKQLRVKIHQDYFQAILFRDLIERHNITHPTALTDLAYKLIDTISSLYSINRLTGYLQSLGHKIPKTVVATYLEWFEDAYFLFTVRLFDASLSRSKANPKKIYCIDHALVTSISSGILLNTGHLLENIVFNALRRTSTTIYYYKTQSGKEVDFLIQYQDRTKTLIQVCESMDSEQTRKREIVALFEAMTELNLTSGTMVTRHEDNEIVLDDRVIHIVPIWHYLLKESPHEAY